MIFDELSKHAEYKSSRSAPDGYSNYSRKNVNTMNNTYDAKRIRIENSGSTNHRGTPSIGRDKDNPSKLNIKKNQIKFTSGDTSH